MQLRARARLGALGEHWEFRRSRGMQEEKFRLVDCASTVQELGPYVLLA